ncbi:hypothetical protein IWW36_004576 [Coemansia brasiliensis]|uniref:Transferase n=1 Tax=Coemansia brasiliensis TaxID=2650707 RepID=A0A9W8I5F7_9FUNG|nr:hypothetical protein IWW36_004576 [Coemansia brasiliensis]
MTVDLPSSIEFRYPITKDFSYLYQVYCSYILLYKNTEGKSNFMPLELLERSLKILVRKYYQPVAGWYQVRDDEIDVVYYNDKFNDPPVSVQILDIDLAELSRHIYESNTDLLVPKAPSGVIKPENPNIPMFLAKATYLESNDAMVLGVNYHHSLMDGSAFWMFMNNWASVCNQLCEQKDKTEFVLPYPPTFEFPDISHLRNPNHSFTHPEYALVDAEQCFKEFQPTGDKIVESMLVISVDQQQQLRQQAKEFGVSFTEMLCAILWKGANDLRLQIRPSIGPEPSLYTCATNSRARLGISSNFCGSPVINTSCQKTVAEIANLDLCEVAHLVHNAIDKCTGEYLCSSIDFLLQQRKKELTDERQGHEGKKAIMLVYVCPMPLKCTVSSSRNFPIYKTDFGFGAPEYVRPPFLPFEGCMRIWPTPQYVSGSSNAPLEVYVSQPDYIDLSQSPLLRNFSPTKLTVIQ